MWATWRLFCRSYEHVAHLHGRHTFHSLHLDERRLARLLQGPQYELDKRSHSCWHQLYDFRLHTSNSTLPLLFAGRNNMITSHSTRHTWPSWSLKGKPHLPSIRSECEFYFWSEADSSHHKILLDCRYHRQLMLFFRNDYVTSGHLEYPAILLPVRVIQVSRTLHVYASMQ